MSELPGLREQVSRLNKKVTQLESENEIVQWYMQVMEQGYDSKEVVQNFAELQKETEDIKKKTTIQIDDLTEENVTLKKKLNQAMKALKRQ